MKEGYDSTHVTYTVTSAFGSVQAMNRTDDNTFYWDAGSLSMEELLRFEELESFPWLEADLTSSGPLTVKPGPGPITTVDPLTGEVRKVMMGVYQAYRPVSEGGEKLSAWNVAEEGHRYIIAAGGMGENGAGSIIFGIIQHKAE